MSTPQDPSVQPGYAGQQRAKRPGALVVSVVLWVLTGLFMLLGGLGAVLLGGSGDTRTLQRQVDAMERRFQTILGPGGTPPIDAAALQQFVVIFGIVLAGLGALLVLLALLMLGRQNWARILLTVLGLIALVLLLGTIVGSLVVLVAIVLHFLPPVNTWFKSRPLPA